jgi:4-amino-4-deoxy-L-arabinose transferase-like glycosyltransferase/putative flippase GtrA
VTTEMTKPDLPAIRISPAPRATSAFPPEPEAMTQFTGIEAPDALAATQPLKTAKAEIPVRRRGAHESAVQRSAARIWEQRVRLATFALNGTAVFAAGLMIQIILVRYAGMGHIPSYIAQTVASVQMNFLLSRYLTWRDRDVTFLPALARFNLQRLTVTGLGMAGYVGLERLGMNYITANVALTAALTPVSFVSSLKWSMDERTPRHRRPGRKLACEEDVAPTATFPAITDEIPATAVEPARRRYKSLHEKKFLWNYPLLLLGILGVQAGLSSRLLWANTTFTDEALYLWAGHLEIAHILHGTQIPSFSAYFSGAPVIYPIVGAMADSLGGLTGARILSMCFMLGATALLWVTTRRLYGDLAAFFAVGMWAILGPTLFLSAFATYDAMSMFLIALAAWLATARRSANGATIWMMAAGVTLALANVTAYSTIIIDPVVVLLAILSAWPQSHGKAAIRRGLLGVVAFTVIYGSLLLAGGYYLIGVKQTVLTRVTGTDKPSVVLAEAFLWIGVVAVTAAVGVILAAVQHRKAADLWLVCLLAAAILLVPLEQARIHTTVSLDKHVDIGAWFAAIATGYALSKLITIWRSRIFRTSLITVALGGVTVMAVMGFTQARTLFGQWPNTASYVATLKPLIARTHGPMLIESAQELEYYLPAGHDWQRWSNTYSINLPSGVPVGYAPGKANTAGNLSVYEALIKRGYFSLIVIDFNSGTPAFDQTISTYLAHDPHYRVVAATSFGHGTSYPILEYIGARVGGLLPHPPAVPPDRPSALGLAVKDLLTLLLAASVIILLAETAVALVSVNLKGSP